MPFYIPTRALHVIMLLCLFGFTLGVLRAAADIQPPHFSLRALLCNP